MRVGIFLRVSLACFDGRVGTPTEELLEKPSTKPTLRGLLSPNDRICSWYFRTRILSHEETRVRRASKAFARGGEHELCLARCSLALFVSLLSQVGKVQSAES